MTLKRFFSTTLGAGIAMSLATAVSAAVITYDLEWSNSQEEGVSASGQISLDTAIWEATNDSDGEGFCGGPTMEEGPSGPPAAPLGCFSLFGAPGEFPGEGITAFNMVLSFAERDVSFGIDDFVEFVLTFNTSIDPTRELVGQDGFFDFNIFAEGQPTLGEPVFDDELRVLAMPASPGPIGISPNVFVYEDYFFDLQSFRVADDMAAVPLPASALLLLTAVGGLGAARKRRNT